MINVKLTLNVKFETGSQNPVTNLVWYDFSMDPICVPTFKNIWEIKDFFVDLVWTDPELSQALVEL